MMYAHNLISGPYPETVLDHSTVNKPWYGALNP